VIVDSGSATSAIAGCRKRRVRVAPPEAQAIFCRRRHQPSRPPPAKIRPGRPAPAMGSGRSHAAATRARHASNIATVWIASLDQ
jgi:hypothetical protein